MGLFDIFMIKLAHRSIVHYGSHDDDDDDDDDMLIVILLSAYHIQIYPKSYVLAN